MGQTFGPPSGGTEGNEGLSPGHRGKRRAVNRVQRDVTGCHWGTEGRDRLSTGYRETWQAVNSCGSRQGNRQCCVETIKDLPVRCLCPGIETELLIYLMKWTLLCLLRHLRKGPCWYLLQHRAHISSSIYQKSVIYLENICLTIWHV